jgi:hypothetical protein
MIAFNPKQAGDYELVDFQRCCVFRMKTPIGPDLTNMSIAVIYRTQLKALAGEFEVIRVETIDKPQTEKTKELYRKAFGYPVTLYDGDYFGPTHIFFRNLRVYSPSIPFDDFMEFRDKRRIKTMHPISHIWLDEEDLDFIRTRTTSVSIGDVKTSSFEDPYDN